MRRRTLFLALGGSLRCLFAASGAPSSIRGTLAVSDSPALIIEPGKRRLPLSGDEPTMGVLRDKRLQNVSLEAVGVETAGQFQIDPIHTKAMFVHKDGKRLLISYWCDVCYIRTYTPGICWCCQKETDLDLRESITD